MSHKTFTRTSVLILLLLACFAIPVSARAGGACGGTYTIQQDETIDTLAANLRHHHFCHLRRPTPESAKICMSVKS